MGCRSPFLTHFCSPENIRFRWHWCYNKTHLGSNNNNNRKYLFTLCTLLKLSGSASTRHSYPKFLRARSFDSPCARAAVPVAQTLIVALQDLLSVEHDVLRIHRDHDSQGWSVSIAALQAELEGLASGAGGAGAAPRTPPPSGGRSGRRGSAGSSSRRGSTSSGNGSRKGKGRGRDVEADQTIRGWSSKRQRR